MEAFLRFVDPSAGFLHGNTRGELYAGASVLEAATAEAATVADPSGEPADPSVEDTPVTVDDHVDGFSQQDCAGWQRQACEDYTRAFAEDPYVQEIARARVSIGMHTGLEYTGTKIGRKGVRLVSMDMYVSEVSVEAIHSALKATRTEPRFVNHSRTGGQTLISLPWQTDINLFKSALSSISLGYVRFLEIAPTVNSPDGNTKKWTVAEMRDSYPREEARDPTRPSIVSVRLFNTSEFPSAKFVRIPFDGDEQVYHHRTGPFVIQTYSTLLGVHLYLEPGDYVDIEIYHHRAGHTPHDPSLAFSRPRVITPEWLCTRSYQIDGVKDLNLKGSA